MITKTITNTTYKKFIMNWNIYKDNILSVKSIHIPPKALNYEISFADETDFLECKRQNALYFANGNLLVGKTTENNAVKQNVNNAKEELKAAQDSIDKEVENLQEQAKKAGRSKKGSANLEVSTEKVGE